MDFQLHGALAGVAAVANSKGSGMVRSTPKVLFMIPSCQSPSQRGIATILMRSIKETPAK